VKQFVNVAPEVNLLRWFNYHLRQAGSPRLVNNFSLDISVLLHLAFSVGI